MTFSANELNYIVLGVGNMEILSLVRALCLIRIKALNCDAQLHTYLYLSQSFVFVFELALVFDCLIRMGCHIC